MHNKIICIILISPVCKITYVNHIQHVVASINRKLINITSGYSFVR